MDEKMIIGIFAANLIAQVAAMAGSYKLVAWRLGKLERSVEAHNKFDRRIIRIEAELDIVRGNPNCLIGGQNSPPSRRGNDDKEVLKHG